MCSCTRKLSRAPASLCRVTSGHQELHNLTSSDLSSGLEAARPQANLQLVRVSPGIYKKKAPSANATQSHIFEQTAEAAGDAHNLTQQVKITGKVSVGSLFLVWVNKNKQTKKIV